MRKTILIFLMIFVSFSLFSCSESTIIDPPEPVVDEDEKPEPDPESEEIPDDKEPELDPKEEFIYTINYAKSIDDYYLYTDMHLYEADQEIPLYNCKVNFSHTWNGEAPMRMNSGVGIVELSGKVKFHLETYFKINNIVTIRPLAKEVMFEAFDNYIDFIIEETGDYTVEFSNQRTLHLFVYDIEEEVPENTIYFGPGIHNKDNSSYINSSGVINIGSNQHIHLALGAILEARLVSNNTNNVKITGRGIIAGAKFERSVERGKTFIPFDFGHVTNLLFKDIICLDPAGWCYNLYFCNHLELDGIKIISSRSNGDGVSLQSCQNAYVHNVFVRSWDDSLVIKNYPEWSNRNIEGTTKNIVFDNCLIWTDLAQSLEIGFETIGQVMEDIHFTNITVLHNFHKPVISIHNGNNAYIKNVSYKNIIVEEAKMGRGDGKNVLIEIQNLFSTTWSSSHKTTALGFIEGITIEDMYVYNASNPQIVITGTIDKRFGYDNQEVHFVKDVTIKNLYINNEKIDTNYELLVTEYLTNLILE